MFLEKPIIIVAVVENEFCSCGRDVHDRVFFVFASVCSGWLVVWATISLADDDLCNWVFLRGCNFSLDDRRFNYFYVSFVVPYAQVGAMV